MQHSFTVYAPTTPTITCRCSAWEHADRPMERGPDGMWHLVADLPPGTHTYTYHLKSLSWFAPGKEIDIADPLARELDAAEQATVVTVPPPLGAGDYAWKHDATPLPDHAHLAIYELYVQDFANGTFDGVLGRLEEIARVGFTAIEFLPLGSADQQKGWGYTPKFFFAVEPRYGTEIELCRLVDKAHAWGMAVIIDGVYNHASRDCPLAHIDHDCYFHHAPQDPDAAWGPQFNYGLNLPGTTEYPARHFVKQKVAHWINLFHIDGIRYDAVSQIRDRDFLGELTAWGRERAGAKPFHAIAECLPLDPALVGLHGPMDAWWREEFSQRMRRLLTGTWDCDELERCFDACRDGYPSGQDVVNYLASHDVGHTVRHLLDRGLDEDAALYRMQLGLTVLFTANGIPMVWMGDEAGCANPAEQTPHPMDWNAITADPRRSGLIALTTRLLGLRQSIPALRGDACTVRHRDDQLGLLCVQRGSGDTGLVLVAVHGQGGDCTCEVHVPAGVWQESGSSREQTIDAEGQLIITLGGWQSEVWVQIH